MRVLIIGANGFIGHSLVKRLMQATDWEVCGIDIESFRLTEFLSHPRFVFHKVDIRQADELVEDEVKRSDVVLPLAAVANPMVYVREPLRSFEIVFEANLRIVKLCAQHGVRLIFPSTSEIYGMCADPEFNEAASCPTFGPVEKERWIYASSKHLLERVVWALGHSGLRFTIFRPFNWFGPNLDDISQGSDGGARVVTLFLGKLFRGETIRLVDGGRQTRSFTYIEDGIDALMLILRAEDGEVDGEIFNIGNPDNECSIAHLAQQLAATSGSVRGPKAAVLQLKLESVTSDDYYGPSYQDVPHRRPDITAIFRKLGWAPKIGLELGLRNTIDWYLHHQQATIPTAAP